MTADILCVAAIVGDPVAAALGFDIVDGTSITGAAAAFAQPGTAGDRLTAAGVDPHLVHQTPRTDLIGFNPGQNIVAAQLFPAPHIPGRAGSIIPVKVQAAAAALLAGKWCRFHVLACPFMRPKRFSVSRYSAAACRALLYQSSTTGGNS